MASHSETAVIFKPGRSLKLHVHINNQDRLSDAMHNRLDGSLGRRADSELSSLSANTCGHVPTVFFHTRRRFAEEAIARLKRRKRQEYMKFLQFNLKTHKRLNRVTATTNPQKERFDHGT